ncbi:MAG: hypothetical protein HZC29_01780 [Thaumarchaeota archaeon]|nr:hypothetical protein [Nitrososphaerota archaeon]
MSGLPAGQHCFKVKSQDFADNNSGWSSQVCSSTDNTPPTIVIGSVAGDSTAPYWDTANDSNTVLVLNGEAGMACKWDSDASKTTYASLTGSCSTASTQATCGFGSISQTFSAVYTYACVDSVGNASTPEDFNFGVDWTVPTTSDNDDGLIHAITYTVTLTEADNVSPDVNISTYWCVDQANSCTPSLSSDLTVSFISEAGVRGVNYLRYYSVDAAGNSQSVVVQDVNVNQLPSFSAASDNAGTIKGGSTVTVSTTASDVDASQTLKLVVCKTSGVSGTDCDGGAGDTYCSSTGSASNPSCNWVSETDNASHAWYAYVFDSLNEASISNPRSDSYTTDSTSPTVSLNSPKLAISDNTPFFDATPSETVSNCYD